MRIAVSAFTMPAHLAGIGFYTRKLYAALAQSPEIEAVCIFTSRETAAALRGIHPRIEVRGYRLPGLMMKVAFSQFAFPFLARGFDLAHCVGNVGSVFRRAPQVITVHDLCHRRLPERFGFAKRLYLEMGFRFSVRIRRAKFICVSASTERDFFEYFPSSRGRTTVVHSASKFAPVPSGQPRRDLLFVGTLEPGKNLALALKALNLLGQNDEESPNLDIVGARGWNQSELPAIAEELGVASKIRFLGNVDDDALRSLYQRALALVFPSRYEGFGLPILEAQSQGCVVIAADNSCLPEVGGAGAAYFRDNDAEDLTKIVMEVTRDPARLEALRILGYENAARFSWERTAAETLPVFRDASRV